eukprot:COSAG05_NODE_379_length_10567_cov_18.553687_2_plen_125_part_00
MKRTRASSFFSLRSGIFLAGCVSHLYPRSRTCVLTARMGRWRVDTAVDAPMIDNLHDHSTCVRVAAVVTTSTGQAHIVSHSNSTQRGSVKSKWKSTWFFLLFRKLYSSQQVSFLVAAKQLPCAG